MMIKQLNEKNIYKGVIIESILIKNNSYKYSIIETFEGTKHVSISSLATNKRIFSCKFNLMIITC